MIFKSKEERIDYCIGAMAMKLDWTFEQTEKVFKELTESEQERMLDTFAFQGSIWGNK